VIGAAFQMQLGNPSNATADTNNHEHFLIQRAVEAIDYSDNLGEPNWASWDLTASDIGSAQGPGTFHTDTNLPPNFNWITPGDYTHSGYDRGHLCPSADRTDTTNNNKLVFFMSNIMPQAPDNNEGPWERLETYCRVLAQTNELLIMCGPNGFNGASVNTNGEVFIPDYTWKIIVVVPQGDGTALSRITTSTRVIAVNVPNISGIRNTPWTNFLTSVNVIQTNTGFTFLTSVPQNVAAALRARVDGVPDAALAISYSGTNVIVTWPSSLDGFSLQQSGDLGTTNWTTFSRIVGDNGTTRSATNSGLTGKLFFRLVQSNGVK